MFTLCCKLYENIKKDEQIIGEVYVYETLGTVLGALLFPFVLLPKFNSFEISFIVILLNLLILLIFYHEKKLVLISFICCILLVLILHFTRVPDKLHTFSIKNQWKGLNIIDYTNSIYGNIVISYDNNQYTLFYNGIPILVYPEPDILFNEEIIHLSTLLHGKVENVLLISGGIGGKIYELLKYEDIKTIDYVELDPKIFYQIKKFSADIVDKELNSYKVKIYNLDGRLFVKKTNKKYDLIFINIPEITSLNVNRLHTVEFYKILKNKLKPDGIVICWFPGSLTYLSEELKKLNCCMRDTLRKVFTNVKILPGDSTNIFFSSNKELFLLPEVIYNRLKEKNVNVKTLTKPYLNYRLDTRWYEWFENNVIHIKTKSNLDFYPIGLFYNINYWNTKFFSEGQKFFKNFENIKFLHLAITIFILFILMLILKKFVKNFTKIFIPYTIFTTGVSVMWLNLILIFLFQIFYGYVYHYVSILTGLFMAGLVIGGVFTTNLKTTVKNYFYLLKNFEIYTVLGSTVIILFVLVLQRFTNLQFISGITLPTIFVLCLLTGFIAGSEFPLASKIYLSFSKDTSETAGALYTADLLGGWLAGISSVIFVPIIGIVNICLLVFILKIFSVTIFQLLEFENKI